MKTTINDTRARIDKLVESLDRDVNALRADPNDDRLAAAVKSQTRQLIADRAELAVMVEHRENSRRMAPPMSDLGNAITPDLSGESRRLLDQALIGRKAAPLSFDGGDLRSLHDSVRHRRTATKAALSVDDVAQAAVPDYRPAPWPGLREMTRVLDQIPAETTDASIVHGFKATTLADAAATVAPGADKPESTPQWVAFQSPVRKIAHYATVEDEIIADFSMFFDVIGTEMIAGLIHTENAQLLVGDGLGTNLSGLVPTAIDAGATVDSVGTDLDAVLAAITRVRTTAFVDPDVIVMHPNDWGSTGFAAAKDANSSYLISDAVTAPRPSLWGLRVILTTQMTENTALVANMARAAKVWVRESPRLEVAPIASGANFVNNTTMVRCEERLALEIVRPEALCAITAV